MEDKSTKADGRKVNALNTLRKPNTKLSSNTEELRETVERLKEDLKAKSDYIALLNEEIAKLIKIPSIQNQHKKKDSDSSNKIKTLEEVINGKEMIINTLKTEVEKRTIEIEDLVTTITTLKKESKILENKPGNNTSQEMKQYYPVKEIKTKTLVNLRIIKNKFNEYGLEKYSIKERTVYPFLDIEIVPHKKMEDCIVIKHKGKAEEVFGGEYTKELLELYRKYTQPT